MSRSRIAPSAVCLVLCAVGIGLSVAGDAPDGHPRGLYSEYVEAGGKKYEVADPIEDPTESNSLQEDKTADWQTEMVNGLMKQRKAERDFIDKLEVGGKSLSEMVTNITSGFDKLNVARQKEGSNLIKKHFEGEIKLLKKSQKDTLADLNSILSVQSSDSEELKDLKTQVMKIIKKNFAKRIHDHQALFSKQMKEIQVVHENQTARVRELFQMIDQWKTKFRMGLKRAGRRLEQISESWDWL